MAKKYRVRLDDDERESLEQLVRSGRHTARKLTRARILLLADERDGRAGDRDVQIAHALSVCVVTVENIRKRCVLEGVLAALNPRPTTRRYEWKFDGEAQAKLIAIACSGPPRGRARWTLQLLADRVVALGIVRSVTPDTVRRTLKKTSCGLTYASAG